MHNIHSAFQPVDSDLPRVHHIRIGIAPRFPAGHILFDDDQGVEPHVIMHTSECGKTIRQFSASVTLVLESWRVYENPEKMRQEIECIWNLQISPNDFRIRDAIDEPTGKNSPVGAIIDELKRVLNMINPEIPLMLGSTLLMRFGHRGKDYPYLEVYLCFNFGYGIIAQKVEKERWLYRQQWRSPIVLFTRILWWVLWACSKVLLTKTITHPGPPAPVDEPPDLWKGHKKIKIIQTRLETILASLLRRIERRYAEEMATFGVLAAPGESHTVAIDTGQAQDRISARRLARIGGVTKWSGTQPPRVPLKPGSKRGRRVIRLAPSGLGKAADHAAPPPPPKGIGTTVTPLSKPRTLEGTSVCIEED